MHVYSTAEKEGARSAESTRSAYPIADALWLIHRSGEVEAQPVLQRVDAVETLATLLDLTGSMALAAHLDSPSLRPIPAAAMLGPSKDPSVLIEERLAQLSSAVDRRFEELPSSRSAIWGPERLATEIAKRGLAGARRGRLLGVLAREACDAHGLAVRGVLDRIRGECRSLRVEIGPRIAALGPAAARLEAIDALVSRARAAATQRLIGRIPAALVDDFAARLSAAVRSLDRAEASSEVASWYAADGFVSQFYSNSNRLMRAVLDHEGFACRELVAAARQLGTSGS